MTIKLLQTGHETLEFDTVAELVEYQNATRIFAQTPARVKPERRAGPMLYRRYVQVARAENEWVTKFNTLVNHLDNSVAETMHRITQQVQAGHKLTKPAQFIVDNFNSRTKLRLVYMRRADGVHVRTVN